MKILWTLAILACAVLTTAAVWMGGLNQDEGWYLYAANLVSEGMIPYRDFFYTQGPVLPLVYSSVVGIWNSCGLLGARIFTVLLGLVSVVLTAATAARLAPKGTGRIAALATFLLLGTNLYHLYYLTIPKTYALASFFVALAFFLLASSEGRRARSVFAMSIAAGLALAFAAGTRISLGAILPVAGLWFLCSRKWASFFGLLVGGTAGVALVYLPFLVNSEARAGLLAAQQYHAARGGFDLVWTVGSFSRLVRWYLPGFVIFATWIAARLFSRAERQSGIAPLALLSFAAVFVVQMLAPFPYEDYQVPVMALFTLFVVIAAVDVLASTSTVNQLVASSLIMFLAFATSFGSPLLEKWSTNGQDRFWSLKKDSFELPQLRRVASEIERLDPGGKELLTQDLYLAIETGRKVPRGLEMGPFAMLSKDEWEHLLGSAPCPLAAMSAYTFAIEPPSCRERPIAEQMTFWGILKRHYELAGKEDSFGQNATTLLILKRKAN